MDESSLDMTFFDSANRAADVAGDVNASTTTALINGALFKRQVNKAGFTDIVGTSCYKSSVYSSKISDAIGL